MVEMRPNTEGLRVQANMVCGAVDVKALVLRLWHEQNHTVAAADSGGNLRRSGWRGCLPEESHGKAISDACSGRACRGPVCRGTVP